MGGLGKVAVETGGIRWCVVGGSTRREDWNCGLGRLCGNLVLLKFPVIYEGDPSKNSK